MAKHSGMEPLTALRHKFAEDLEEILQCMVCYETLSIPIPLCTEGHHVCRNCQPQMTDCPYCKSKFNGTRNYLAESLIGKFEEIKTSLIDPHNRINIKSMISIATQTDSMSENNVEVVLAAQPLIIEETNKNKPLIDYKVAPIVGKGKYQCKIGGCSEELVHGRMIPHLRYYHKDELIEEKIINSRLYENSWEFSYQIPNVLERAINIPNMGLFFLNISINDEGNLYGNLKIVNTRIIAQQFEYSIEVINGHNSIAYKGQVLGMRTRDSKNTIEKSLWISNLYLSHFLKKKRIFTCRLLLNRTFQSEELLKKD